MEAVRQELETLTSMGITLEQHGGYIRFLEYQLDRIHGPHPILLPDYKSEVAGSTAPTLRRLLDPGTPNAAPMLKSLIPNWCKKAAHYRTSQNTAKVNITRIQEVLTLKGYKPTMWTANLRRCAEKWGLPKPSPTTNPVVHQYQYT